MIYVHMASSLNKQAFVAGLLWLKGETDAQNIQNTDAFISICLHIRGEAKKPEISRKLTIFGRIFYLVKSCRMLHKLKSGRHNHLNVNIFKKLRNQTFF